MSSGKKRKRQDSDKNKRNRTAPATTDTKSPKREHASLLESWMEHDDVSFHDFTDEEASAIRKALLRWYRENRRRLPWRGDRAPFSGSTAGKKKTSAKSGKDKGQARINSFFSSKPKEKKQKPLTEEKKEDDSAIAIPVSGYSVWVSEIMLQQTVVEAVIPYYTKWMKRFPTVYELAAASEDEVNAHWAGLGFYRRARMLHAGAKLVVDKYDGRPPETVDELLKIPGIGPYTASAVASIAYNVSVPVVDGNVCRVLSRLKGVAQNIKASVFKDDLGWRLAKQIVAADGGDYAGEVNQAMMELGATYCAPSGTGTDDQDPLKPFYYSTRIGREVAALVKRNGPISDIPPTSCQLCDPEGISTVIAAITNDLNTKQKSPEEAGHASMPLQPPKKNKREEVLAVAAIHTSSHWLMIKRPKTGLLANQWEFPSVCVWCSTNSTKNDVPIVKVDKRNEALNSFLRELVSEELVTAERHIHKSSIEHVFSHVRHTMWLEHTKVSNESYDQPFVSSNREVRWMSEDDMKNVGVTSGVKKILKVLRQKIVKSR